MKLSQYPLGTVIEIEGYGEYKKMTNWWEVTTDDEAHMFKGQVDKLQEDGVKITIISVPWGVTEQLIEKIWEWQINEFGSYEIDHLDAQDKDAIFEDAVDEYKKLKTAKWLVESEEVRAKTRERIEKMREQRGAVREKGVPWDIGTNLPLSDKWGIFRAKCDSELQERILNFGPGHPDHPEHEHTDCCK
ncbi:hypothetical protein PP914_gp221 [Arthrobacter phage Qui]|uniref:Uncharacterized protein n=1 Tax=Arthrobacter phage Qui TaxID=2603260 RepID=A0A5B8WI18_9CAUD|nr:hypothetical protein PP914_gp221 [Arthrobacter phage Qui]QED11709.1 hypothetical protein SEA_QUI_221 [Arthrobacter phage Qui]QOC56540.1 hypothetical protein SEA_PAELLA_221 [Arthrobacter phage Paella]